MSSDAREFSIRPPGVERQLGFHQLLVAARALYLNDALRDALQTIDPRILKAQIATHVPEDVQRLLAGAGIRDEYVFPTPVVLTQKPTLVGYYRLLLGVPQKSFYTSESGMGPFKNMEFRGVINDRQRAALPAFCKAMSASLAELVRQLSPQVTTRDIDELPLLTLGSQFQGGNNNTIGKKATIDVFLAIAAIVVDQIEHQDERRLSIRNASGRRVVISLTSDPDVTISEEFGDELRPKVAIEIKGGGDRSNVHNRAGEAEKSHQKAKQRGFRDFWTIIALKSIDTKKLERESPTTTSWFDAAQILGQKGDDWDLFRSRISEVSGIPVKDLGKRRRKKR